MLGYQIGQKNGEIVGFADKRDTLGFHLGILASYIFMNDIWKYYYRIAGFEGIDGISDLDLLCENGRLVWFDGKRIDNPNTHGTGCTLSSAIASNLAKGLSLAESVKRAKEYISAALAEGLDLGKGSGPMKHNFMVNDGI